MAQHWSELLDSIVQASGRVAAVDLSGKRTTNHSTNWNAAGSRIAGQHERALFTDEQGNVISGDPSKAAIYNQITQLKSKTPSENEQNIHKLFDAVLALMEVCYSAEAQELLDEMKKRYESVFNDIQGLENKLEQREREEENRKRKSEVIEDEDESGQIQATIEKEQKDIKELEREISKYKKKMESIDATIAQLQEVNEQAEAAEVAAASIDNQTSNIATVEMIDEMKAAIKKQEQALAKLDEEEEAMAEETDSWIDSVSAPLASTKALEKLRLAVKRAKGSITSEASMDISKNTSVKEQLDSITAETEQCLLLNTDTELARNISEWLVDRVASGDVKMPATSGSAALSGETIMAALVLQTLQSNQGELSFIQLKEQVLHHALDQQCDAQQAVRAVYTLVANALVDIDRSTRDNTVRLI
ncbi:hypothetical protein BDF19DRAFT_419514 [Syncephalis fuscata]|nr:hypothetical protein BDF19DRAFT_419514 [Syncephalis fuscata]